MHRFVLTAELRRGSAPEVARILREGPPFDISKTSLERHEVFLSDEEIVFLFEGPHADREASRLLSSRRVLSRGGRIGAHLLAPPRTPAERFSWERPVPLDGVAFGPQPGPGYSEGGPAD
jgi:hypothetical protein